MMYFLAISAHFLRSARMARQSIGISCDFSIVSKWRQASAQTSSGISLTPCPPAKEQHGRHTEDGAHNLRNTKKLPNKTANKKDSEEPIRGSFHAPALLASINRTNSSRNSVSA